MKKLITILMLIATMSVVNSQNTNVRAQGNYYSAKSNFQSKNYEEALKYVNKCKAALLGTNRELQYLHILAAFKLNKYEEAAKELQTYFDMEEKKSKIVYFDKSVDRLSYDETKELSMLIDPILESAEHRKNNPCNRCNGSGLMKKSIACGDCSGRGNLKEKCKVSECYNGKIDCNCQGCGNMNGVYKIYGCSEGKHSCDNESPWSSFGSAGSFRQWRRDCVRCDNGSYNCSKCKGTDYIDIDCNKCNNTGSVASAYEEVTCNKCYGKGF
jgi:hypothetical protein